MSLFRIHSVILIILLLAVTPASAQETVFTGMQSNWKKAQKNYQRGSYQDALKYYLAAEPQKRTPREVYLQLAQTCAHLKDHQKAVYWFKRYHSHQGMLPGEMSYKLAESLVSLGQYQEAISWYEAYGSQNPTDQRVREKIWRIKNIQYLYEDSVYYSVTPVSFNSNAMEFAPYCQGNQLYFVSNRELYGGVKVLDGIYHKPFFKRYKVTFEKDPNRQEFSYSKPEPYQSTFDGKFHHGPISFSTDGSLAVFTQSSSEKDDHGNYPVQLYYADKVGYRWGAPVPISFEDAKHTVRNPSLSADGQTLYFSAEFPGGLGGKDLYKSQRTPQGWSKPENLGSLINTAGDEDFPFIHNHDVLYFASNGHGGLGGLDIFEVHTGVTGKHEVRNLGYPVNTQFDDFAIYLNENKTLGYISSNRTEGGMNDDLFQLEVDLQTYPLTIRGTMKYRNAQWEDDRELNLLTGGQLQLIDIYNGKTVYETVSGNAGEVVLEIPYSSQFRIKVLHKELGTHSVSLEIPKNKKLHNDHEIVIVREQFQNGVPQAIPGEANRKANENE